MPIIEPEHSDSPLDQGDLLRGVKLFVTSRTDSVDGGEATPLETSYCLVISRPCVIAHKPTIIVAAVEKYKANIPDGIDTFRKVKSFLEGLRNGEGAPDQFYLGQLPGDDEQGRFAAKLDSIQTIRVSSKPEDRDRFVKKHRFARLHEDFQRDLHSRLFQAFSVLGFDDIQWYSLPDLKYLVQVGRAEILRLESQLGLQTALQEAEGDKNKQRDVLTKQIAESQKQLEKYVAELDRREANAD